MTVMIRTDIKTKKELKAIVKDKLDQGSPINVAVIASDPSIFGNHFNNGNGKVVGTNHPKRSWFATLHLVDYKVVKVE